MSDIKWLNNPIQFARLIAELEAAGAFNKRVMRELRRSMDLSDNEISELVDRAQEFWEEAKTLPTLAELEDEGIVLEQYPVDESQSVSNAGDAVVYNWNDRFFEVITWRDNAEDHREGEVKISEIFHEDEDEN